MSTPTGPDASLGPIEVREARVQLESWTRWVQTARRNAPRAWWGGTAALTLGTVSIVLGLLILDDSNYWAIGAISPVAAAVGWWLGRRAGERSFRVVADEMRGVVCPSLVRIADSDDLMRLARRGEILFAAECVHMRSTVRDGEVVLTATEYDLSHTLYEWPSAGGIA